MFLGEQEPACLKSADANDDATIDISDPVALLEFQFLGGLSPPAPHATCGLDPTLDELECAAFPPCP
jgi:hypothetical protein